MLSRFSSVQLFATIWTVAHQSPLSMGFSKQEYWSGLPCPPPADLPNPGIEPAFLMSPALTVRFFTTSATWQYLKLISGNLVIHSRTYLLPLSLSNGTLQKVTGCACLSLQNNTWLVGDTEIVESENEPIH